MYKTWITTVKGNENSCLLYQTEKTAFWNHMPKKWTTIHGHINTGPRCSWSILLIWPHGDLLSNIGLTLRTANRSDDMPLQYLTTIRCERQCQARQNYYRNIIVNKSELPRHMLLRVCNLLCSRGVWLYFHPDPSVMSSLNSSLYIEKKTYTIKGPNKIMAFPVL